MKNKSLAIFLFCFSILFGQQMDKDSIYLNVEKMPIIKGGFAAVGKKIKYPNIAKQMGMQGVVYIGFIVNSEGKVEDPKILNSVAKIIDEEAISEPPAALARVLEINIAACSSACDGKSSWETLVRKVAKSRAIDIANSYLCPPQAEPRLGMLI